MKKFLFTLAALMTMGSAYAVDVITIPDQNLTDAQFAAGTITVSCPAQFDHYVSAWNLDIKSMPEGLSASNLKWDGNGQKIYYFDDEGEECDYRPEIMGNYPTWLAACMAMCYDEEGNYMGAPHWQGTYTKFVKITFTWDASFKGGVVEYSVEPSAGGWGDHSNDCPQNSHYDLTCTFTVPTAPELTDLTADITIGDAQGLFVPITVANVNDPEAEIVVTVGETTYPIENGGITLPEWDTDYTVVVTVTAKGEEYTGTVTESKPVHTGVQPVTDCEIVWTAENGQVSVDVVSEDGAVEHLYMGREEVAIPYTTTYDIYEGYGPKTFTATAQAPGKAQGTDEAVVKADPVEKQNFQGEITIGDPDDNGVVAVGYTGTETGYTMTVTVDGVEVTPVNGTVTVTEGNHNIEVTISAEGYNDLTDDKDVTYTAPVTPTEQCLAPNTAYVITGTEQATVTITNREEGATVHYVVTCDGDTVMDDTFTGESYSFTVTGDGAYVVTAIATMPTKLDSTDGGCFFTIQEGEQPTGINEIANGKTVAGVRYYNMAGQEMSEANGMTIVVTTYTDGTTSAVKVMK